MQKVRTAELVVCDEVVDTAFLSSSSGVAGAHPWLALAYGAVVSDVVPAFLIEHPRERRQCLRRGIQVATYELWVPDA